MHLDIQWPRLVPSLIFPVSLAVSLIAFDRSQVHHNTLRLSRRLKKLPQTQIFGGWAGMPLPYKTFNWKQHTDSNLFQMSPSPGIDWIGPKTPRSIFPRETSFRGDRAEGGKPHRNAEVCGMAPSHQWGLAKARALVARHVLHEVEADLTL